jgi:putative ATP-dependent endonuclease of OLD family
MKLVCIRLRNFRCYKAETCINIDDLTVLVGKNDAGKSAVFDALAIFFEESKLDSDDASVSGDKKDVRIICEFEDFPESLIIDANYPTTLASEYLLNERGRLEIHKAYDGSLKTPKPTGTYAYAVHPSAPEANDLLLLKNSELKQRAVDLNVPTDSIDTRVNTLLRHQIWASVNDLQPVPQEIPLDQETAKKVWGQLGKYLPCFALFRSDRPSTDQDAEAQDPMKAAVKEALKEKEAELNLIADYVREEVCRIAEQTVAKLREMDSSLASELRPHFRPPNWTNVFKISLTDDDEIPMNKRGSGVRRLILLNFFRAKAEQAAIEKKAPSVIYAVEEPETSQHPHNQKMLMRAFGELSEYPNCQVMLSTHTPVLARLVPAECLHYIDVEESENRSIYQSGEETYRLVAESLGVLPDHDVSLFVGVEGGNDINFLMTMSEMLVDNGEDVPNLCELEEEGKIVFFPLGGSNLALWTSRLAGLNRPELYVFDRDTEPPAKSKYHESVEEISARPECIVFETSKKEMENYLHPGAIKAVVSDVDISFGDFDDVPLLVAQAVHEASESEKLWDQVSEKKKDEKMRKAKAWLNTKTVEAMTPAMLDGRDPNGDIRGWLAEIGRILRGD